MLLSDHLFVYDAVYPGVPEIRKKGLDQKEMAIPKNRKRALPDIYYEYTFFEGVATSIRFWGNLYRHFVHLFVHPLLRPL